MPLMEWYHGPRYKMKIVLNGKGYGNFGDTQMKQKITQPLPDRWRFPAFLKSNRRTTSTRIVRREGSHHASLSKLLLSSAPSESSSYLSAWHKVKVVDARQPRTWLSSLQDWVERWSLPGASHRASWLPRSNSADATTRDFFFSVFLGACLYFPNTLLCALITISGRVTKTPYIITLAQIFLPKLNAWCHLTSMPSKMHSSAGWGSREERAWRWHTGP